MLCPKCFGSGQQWFVLAGNQPPGQPVEVPVNCSQCQGLGHLHCCEGDCEHEHDCPVYIEKSPT